MLLGANLGMQVYQNLNCVHHTYVRIIVVPSFSNHFTKFVMDLNLLLKQWLLYPNNMTLQISFFFTFKTLSTSQNFHFTTFWLISSLLLTAIEKLSSNWHLQYMYMYMSTHRYQGTKHLWKWIKICHKHCWFYHYPPDQLSWLMIFNAGE